jgi:hypothetical protein
MPLTSINFHDMYYEIHVVTGREAKQEFCEVLLSFLAEH